MNKIYTFLLLIVDVLFCVSPSLVWLLNQMKNLNGEDIKSNNQVEMTYFIAKTYLLVFLCAKIAIFVFEVIFFIYNLKRAKNNEQIFG